MENMLFTSIIQSFKDLIEQDGELFGFKVNAESEKNGRKLHEVCINHKFSIHLSNHIFPLLQGRDQKYFTDIEFNRNGVREKAVFIDNSPQVVRPDIIIHNRKDGDEKSNFLVVECKKRGCSQKEYDNDVTKIQGLMTSEDYKYEYGLMVLYDENSIEAQFFWHTEEGIASKALSS